MKTNGSAINYADYLRGCGVKNVPDVDVFRKIVSEQLNEDIVSTCWIANLLEAAESAANFIKYKKIRGFVQNISIYPSLLITIYCEAQLKLIHSIPIQRRLVHIDATGQLVYIPKVMQEYNRIMNYAMLIRDSYNSDNRAVIINENISSQQNTLFINSIFTRIKFDYQTLYPKENKIFQLIVCDLAWPTIHGVLQSLCNEDIIEYSQRVYDLSDNKNTQDKTWLGSCASHTMKRYVGGVKKNVTEITSVVYQFYVYTFNLLLNCQDLTAFGEILRLIFICILSEFRINLVDQAFNTLQSLIEKRPVLDERVEQIIRTSINFFDNQSNSSNNDDEDLFVADESIRSRSPFTKFSVKIEDEVKSKIQNNSASEMNSMYSLEYMDFLQKNFLPYAFIWSGFVYKTLDTRENTSRITNGVIERFFATRKRLVPSALLPVKYLNKIGAVTLGQIEQGLSNCDFVDKLIDDGNLKLILHFKF